MPGEHKDFFSKMFTFLGGFGGLLSIALIIWKGGFLWQTVTVDHERRINNIEQGGSVGLREHIKLDDERVRELQSQQDRDRLIRERLLDNVTSVASEVKVINSKLDAIKEQINGKPKP